MIGLGWLKRKPKKFLWCSYAFDYRRMEYKEFSDGTIILKIGNSWCLLNKNNEPINKEEPK